MFYGRPLESISCVHLIQIPVPSGVWDTAIQLPKRLSFFAWLHKVSCLNCSISGFSPVIHPPLMIKVHIYYVAIGKNNRMSGKIFLAHSNNPYRFATWVKYIITNLKRTMSFPPINRQNRSIISAQFPMPGRHGYHQAWRSAFPHVKQKGVQRRADFFMHPAHEVMRARRVYEADERLLRQCLLNKPQVRLFTPHHGKPPLPFWQRPLGTFPKGQWIPVTLATCFRPVTQVPSCLSPSYPGVSCTEKSGMPYPSA